MKKSLAVLLLTLFISGTANADFRRGGGFNQGDLTIDKNSVDFDERSDNPSTPGSNRMKLFAKDNGSGTSKLYTIDSSGSASELTIGGYTPGGTDVALADGGTGASLTDPNANRIVGWDDTDGATKFWTLGTGLTYDEGTDTLSGTTSDVVCSDCVTLGTETSGNYVTSLTAGTAIDVGAAAEGGTPTIDFDSTELGTTTFGSGSGIVWTFNASGGTDPTITFGDAAITLSNPLVSSGSGSSIIFEGATDDDFETTLTVTDPTTPDKTITFPNTTGTVALTSSNVATATALAANGANCGAGNYPLGVDASGAVESCTAAGGAPTDADYLVGTTNGSLSAEIVVGTSPGGELGNTWASPTLDDSVTVSTWTLGGTTTIGSTTGGTITSALGIFTVASVGNTNNESLLINLEDSTTSATISSGTGLTRVLLSGLDLESQDGTPSIYVTDTSGSSDDYRLFADASVLTLTNVTDARDILTESAGAITVGAAGATTVTATTDGGTVIMDGTIRPSGNYLAADGSAGHTGTTCTAFKNGICTAGA